MEVNVFRRPGMNKVKPYALAGLHSDCVSGLEHSVTDREEDFLFVVERTRSAVVRTAAAAAVLAAN